jgi:lysophospholipase L1-like esterase
MDELTFEAEPFHEELDRAELARSVVAALVRGGGVRDATRLTHAAFLVHYPDRDRRAAPDPLREPRLAAEWARLRGALVEPALAPGAEPAARGPILLIGDSHTHGAFGTELTRLLAERGARVERHAKIGSAVKYWLPRIPELLRARRPATVVIALGANLRDYPSASGTSAQIRQLVGLIRREAPGARLVWIGPPRRRGDTDATLQRVAAIVRAGLDAKTTWIDSAPHTPEYRGADGVHYAEATAKDWARGVATQLGGSDHE